jgi:M6 family metalloprotease-like protein
MIRRSWCTMLALSALLLTHVHVASQALGSKREPGWRVRPEDNPNFVVFDLPLDQIEKRLSVSGQEMLRRQAAVPVQARSDSGVALALLCQWEDDLADTVAHPREAYETLLFSQGEVDPGSMQEYFLEVSYGSYLIEGDVHGWFTQPTYVREYWFTDFFQAADPFIDYSQFDRDHDGYVDAVWVFHAGPGQEETHDPSHIWSYALYGLNWMTDDGVVIDRYACNPEEHADGSITTIRVACHEASHVLGLPDLYDYHGKLDTTTYYTPGDVNDHPLVDWCLMGYAGYSIMSHGTRQDPAHLCAWSKSKLGFVTPIILTESMHDVPLPEVETNPVVYQIDNPDPGSQEYFLLENRNSNSCSKFDHLDSDFSAYFPWFTPGQNQKDPGLLILHVDDAVPYNDLGPNDPHYMVTVEDAGYDSRAPWDGYDEYSEWWYPYEFRIAAAFAAEDEDQARFTPTTTPNSDWYASTSGVWITNVSRSDSCMTLDIGFGNAWPAIVEYSPVSLTPTVLAEQITLFEVDATDEDGDPTTYEWYEDGALMQSGTNPAYPFQAGPAGSVDTLMAVATDGELADSLTWIVSADTTISIFGERPVATSSHLTATPVPSAAAVTLQCTLPHGGHMRLTIHDPSGRLVSVLSDGHQQQGLVTHVWCGTDLSGREVAPGVYFARLVMGDVLELRRLVVVR